MSKDQGVFLQGFDFICKKSSEKQTEAEEPDYTLFQYKILESTGPEEKKFPGLKSKRDPNGRVKLRKTATMGEAAFNQVNSFTFQVYSKSK